MKTTSSVVVSRLQCFKRHASLIMAGLAAAVLVSSSVFAQTDNGLDPEMSIEIIGFDNNPNRINYFLRFEPMKPDLGSN